VQVQVVQGEIFYDGTVTQNGRYEFNTHSGDVHLYLAESARGTLFMQSFSGTLESSFPLVLQPDSATVRPGQVRSFTSGSARVNVRGRTLNEPQRLDFGGGGGAQVRITTFNGDIHISRGPRRADKE
jgi:hypothetical protein